MRILIFPKDFPSKESPTAGIFILRSAQALRERGHEVEVVRIVPHAPPIGAKWRAYRAVPPFEEVQGIAVRTIRAIVPPRMIGLEYLPMQVDRALAREIECFRPDVLHANFLLPCGHVAVRQHVPTVVTAHGSDAYRWPLHRNGLRRAASEAIAKATRVTAVSDFIRRRVQEIEERDVTIVMNGADERVFHPRDARDVRERFDLPCDRFVAAFAGNIVRTKGVFDLVSAASMMEPCNRPVIALAGSGPQATMLADYARERGVDLRLLGSLDQEGVAALFSAADVVVLPSYNEGMPNVICEAMLAGRAVIASTVGGIPEIITHRTTGMLIEPGDVTALASALEELRRDCGLREAIGSNARAYAREHLTWAINAQGYERVYREAIDQA